MEPKAKQISPEIVIIPQQVWETLGATQRAIVMQTIIRICQEKLDQWLQEEKDEPVLER